MRFKEILANMGFKVFLGLEIKQGWTHFAHIFLFKCERCGKLVQNKIHCFRNIKYLECPECHQEHYVIFDLWLIMF